MTDTDAHFLVDAEPSEAAQRLFDEDLADHGFVMNLSRLWAHRPELQTALFDLVRTTSVAAGLSMRQRSVLVSAMAAARGDAYCALAWGTRLADQTSPETAATVLRGALPDDDTDRALAAWARDVTLRPNDVGPDDLDRLRVVGFDDAQILAITLFVGLRLAFSTVNDALGARPDRELLAQAPAAVAQAVAYGRPPAR